MTEIVKAVVGLVVLATLFGGMVMLFGLLVVASMLLFGIKKEKHQ